MEECFDIDAVFSGDYEVLHEDYLTSEQAEWDVEEILRLLPGPVHSILDAPCGWGRIAHRLALLNFDVMGVDRSQEWIARAQALGRATSSAAAFAVGDLATFSTPRTFDAVLCWFNSFGYGDDEWNASVLETFANATSPGGVVLINTLSAAHIAEYLEGRVHEEVTPTTDGAIVERSSFDVVEQRLVTVRSRAGSPESSGVVASVRLYDDRAWTVMLERAGFTDVSFEPRLMPTNADAEFEVTVVATRR